MAPQSIKPYSNPEMNGLPASLASSQASAESLRAGLSLGNTASTSQVTSTQAGDLPCPSLGDPACSGEFADSAELASGPIRCLWHLAAVLSLFSWPRLLQEAVLLPAMPGSPQGWTRMLWAWGWSLGAADPALLLGVWGPLHGMHGQGQRCLRRARKQELFAEHPALGVAEEKPVWRSAVAAAPAGL